jgi:hypothetical protein
MMNTAEGFPGLSPDLPAFEEVGMGGPDLFPPLALTLHLVSDPSQKMRDAFAEVFLRA